MKEFCYLLIYAYCASFSFRVVLGQEPTPTKGLLFEISNSTSNTTNSDLDFKITEDELHMDNDESEITRCHSHVSNTFFNQGLRLAIASMKNRLADGIPEYGIPPMVVTR